jgi:Arc/MetJ family transcription regulator
MKVRTTVEIDDELLKKAMEYYGCRSKTQILNMGLQELIRSYGRHLLMEDFRLGRGIELAHWEEDQAEESRLERESEERLERLWNGEDPPRG